MILQAKAKITVSQVHEYTSNLHNNYISILSIKVQIFGLVMIFFQKNNMPKRTDVMYRIRLECASLCNWLGAIYLT